MASEIFISHATADRSIAELLCTDLESDGLRCWIAPRDVPAAGDYAQVIPDAIKGSGILLLLLSAAAAASPHIEREVHLAGGRKIPILPIRLDETEPSGALLFFLVSAQWIDAFPRPETQFGRIRAEVRRLLAARGVTVPATTRVSPFRRVIAATLAWLVVLALAATVLFWLRAHWFNLVPASKMPGVVATTSPVALLFVLAMPVAALCLQFWSHRSLRQVATLDALFAATGGGGARARLAGAAILAVIIGGSAYTAAAPVTVNLEQSAIAAATSRYEQKKPCSDSKSYVAQTTSHYAVQLRVGRGNPAGRYVLHVELAPYATTDGVELCEVWVAQGLEIESVTFGSADERRAGFVRIVGKLRDAPVAAVVRLNVRHYRDSEPAPETSVTAQVSVDGFPSVVDHERIPKTIWAAD